MSWVSLIIASGSVIMVLFLYPERPGWEQGVKCRSSESQEDDLHHMGSSTGFSHFLLRADPLFNT